MSVGHVQRAVEEAGIPTVSVFVKAFRFRAERMKLPRVVVTRHPMGRPMGAAHDAERHKLVLRRALGLLQSATQGESFDELAEDFRAVGTS